MPTLKKDASQNLIGELDALERTADECWRPLRLLNYASDHALWALLVRAVDRVEQHRRRLPPGAAPSGPMIANLSRATAIALRWAAQHGGAQNGTRTWDAALAQAIDEAIALGQTYSHFEVCFQGFHKDLYAADLLASNRVRFTGDSTPRYRQVRAFQQYSQFRPPQIGVAAPIVPLETPRVLELMASTFNGCRSVSQLQFEYDEPRELWIEMYPQMRERLRGLTRRAADMSLGPFTLDEFCGAYAAILTVVAAHDFLSFSWWRRVGVYPLESALVVRERNSWINTVSALSGIAQPKCAAVLSDLSFDPRRSVDLHVHPMVPLDDASRFLAIAPPFPMHANHEENILLVCSQRRKDVFDAISTGKEAEMTAALRPLTRAYYSQESVGLPERNPNIDLILADDAASTVIFAELKWIRKPLRALDIPARDSDLQKGIDQLRLIRTFLSSNPRHLSAQRRLPRPLTEYEHVQYLLVARDHWLWAEPCDGIATVQFDAFAGALRRASNLAVAVDELLSYAWLPVEGRNFEVRFETDTANGVSIEFEVFYAR